jgi:signal transduction histidine kinase/ActR/RegA family two-component response regulator
MNSINNTKGNRWDIIDALVRLEKPIVVFDETLSEVYHISPEVFALHGIPPYDDEKDGEVSPVMWLESVFSGTPENERKMKKLKETFQNGGTSSAVFFLGDRQTEQYAIRVALSKLRTDEGEKLILMAFSDITSEINSYKAHYDDELGRYKTLVEYAFCGIVLFERTLDSYRLIEANDTAAVIAGLQVQDELLDSHLSELEAVVFPEDYDMIKTGFDNLLYIGDSFHFTSRIRNFRDGEISIITGIAVAVSIETGGESRNFIQCTFINTTERAELDESKRQIRLLEKKLMSAENSNRQKNMLLEDVIGHIKSNLNNIVGKAVIAKARPEHIEQNADSVIESAKAVLELVNNVLDITLIEEQKLFLNPRKFGIAEIFETLKNMVSPMAALKEQQLGVYYNNIVHTSVFGDSGRLETVFSNILSNAIKYTPVGGTISMTVTETAARHGFCAFTVQISDNGIGMTKEKLRSVLTPYSTKSRKDRDFSGYGLPLANELIKLLGGNIRIESNPGVGTNVYTEIMFAADDPEEYPEPPTEYSFTGKQILLVEDNEISREMFAELLEEEGAAVEKAESGIKAVKLFEESSVYHFDIIFMDIAMPEMDGIEATKRIRAMYRPDARTVPIIALTAKSPGEEVAEGLNFGMDAYEQKPFDMKRIKRVLSVINV